jgi:PQQ-like domain
MNGLRALVALVVIGLVWAAPAAAAKSFCGVRGRPSPGAGKLEWKPDGRLSVTLTGFVGARARDGNTLYVAAGSSGNAISAIDLRTGRRLPFRAATPSGTQARHLAVSPTAVYAIANRFEDSTDAILAFDRRTGARLAGFNVADFGDGSVIYSVTYVHGTVVLSGAPPLGDGTGLGAFDPATGAPVWRRTLSELGFEIRNVVTDGARLYVKEPTHLMAAFDAATGAPIPTWGAAIRPGDYPGSFMDVVGLDATRVYGVTLKGEGARFSHRVVVARSDGHPVSLPHLPPAAQALRSGTSRTILGNLRTRKTVIDAVFDSTGRLIGTVCSFYRVIAQRDDRRLIATKQGPTSTRIIELARP